VVNYKNHLVKSTIIIFVRRIRSKEVTSLAFDRIHPITQEDIMSSYLELEEKIKHNASRLLELTKPEDKRVKKRVLQTLGKLKKELEALKSGGGRQLAAEDATASSSVQGGSKRKRTEEGEEEEEEEVEDNEGGLSGGGQVKQPTRKQLKMKLKLLNQELAEFALKKQLKMARKRFAWGVKRGMEPDVHTYTNLLNANVRCGDMREASSLMVAMKNNGIRPNVVTFTTLLKGYCEAGDLQAAKRVMMVDMVEAAAQNNQLFPNTRTVNTLLRGCVRKGHVEMATQVWSFVKQHQARHVQIAPDSCTYESIVALLCQGLRLEEAEQLLEEADRSFLASNSSSISTSAIFLDKASMHLSLARAYALLGSYAHATTHLASLQTSSDKSKSSALLAKMQAHSTSTSGAVGGGGGGAKPLFGSNKGGKKRSRGIEEDEDEDEEEGDVSHASASAGKRSSSIDLFTRHRREEMEGEATLIHTHILAQTQAAASGGGEQEEIACAYLLECMSRLLLLQDIKSVGEDLEEEEEEDEEGKSESSMRRLPLAGQLVLSLVDRFGLNRVAPTAIAHKQTSAAIHASASKQAKKDVPKRLLQSVQSDDSLTHKILLPELFRNAHTQTHTQDILPVKLEIGSGAGEWVVAQAKADAQTAHWIAIEWRCDRTYHTMCRAAFERSTHTHTPNLSFICGDAKSIVPLLATHTHTHTNTLDAVFANHPEPPESTSNDKQAQGQHLLDVPFLQSLLIALKPQGTLTIVTDSLPYAKQLAESLATLRSEAMYRSSAQKAKQGGGAAKEEEEEVEEEEEMVVEEVYAFRSVVLEEEEGLRRVDERFPLLVSSSSSSSSPSSSSSSSSSSSAAVTNKKARVGSCDKRNILLYRGEAGVDAGHSIEASSYFDRMWEKGSKKRRWFLFVKKQLV